MNARKRSLKTYTPLSAKNAQLRPVALKDVKRMPPAARPRYDASMPVWIAALLGSHLSAVQAGRARPVRWRVNADRIVFINESSTNRELEPFGVTLRSGDVLEVFWAPGDTGYTLHVPDERSANRFPNSAA